MAPPKTTGAGPTLAAAKRLGHRLEDLPPPPAPADREALAFARLRRAAERHKKRGEKAAPPGATRKRAEIYARKNFAEVSKSRGNREVVRTPFGEARFGRGLYTTQPYGTLDRDDWGKGKLPKHNYDAIVSALPKEGEKVQGIADEIGGFLANDAPPKPTSHAQTRAEKAGATLLSGLLAVAEPHEERNPVGGKVERAAVRRAGKEGFKQVFNRKQGEYVPAWATAAGAKIGGTQAWREIRAGSRPIPARTLDLLDELSPSSDEGAEKTPVRRRAARRRSRKRKAAPAETPPSKKAAPKGKRARSKPAKEEPEKKPARKAPRKRKRRAALADETKPPKKPAGRPPRKRKRV